MLIQFFTGLLMLNPLPSLNYAYSVLIQEENQDQVVSCIVSSLDSTVLYSSSG